MFAKNSNMKVLTKGDNLPHEDAEAPDVGLGGEHGEVERFWGHPPVHKRLSSHVILTLKTTAVQKYVISTALEAPA